MIDHPSIFYKGLQAYNLPMMHPGKRWAEDSIGQLPPPTNTAQDMNEEAKESLNSLFSANHRSDLSFAANFIPNGLAIIPSSKCYYDDDCFQYRSQLCRDYKCAPATCQYGQCVCDRGSIKSPPQLAQQPGCLVIACNSVSMPNSSAIPLNRHVLKI